MITGTIAVILLIAMICAAGDGQWGSVAVGAVIVVILLAIGSAGREHDRACNNWVDYWANGDRRHGTGRSRASLQESSRPGRATAQDRRDAAEKREQYIAERRRARTGGAGGTWQSGKAFVCHFCCRYVHAASEVVETGEGIMRMYRCPSCGKMNITKL